MWMSWWTACSGLTQTAATRGGSVDNLGNAISDDYAGVVKVREAILAKKERVFGAESEKVGEALWDLGLAYGALRRPREEARRCERALPIYERDGSDHAEVAELLNGLGNRVRALGDYAKQRDMQERARSARSRPRWPAGNLTRTATGDHAKWPSALGRPRPHERRTYVPLNQASCYAKARDMLLGARARDRNRLRSGRSSSSVTTVLRMWTWPRRWETRVLAYGRGAPSAGDYAKRYRATMQERALAIKERW